MQNAIEDRRVILVDDEPVKLEGRRSWLISAGFRDVTTLDFHQALIFRDWNSAHTLVVDGLDEAEDDARAAWVSELAQGDPLFPLDRFMGVRVVRAARAANPDLVITVVSSFVDRSPAMVQRFHKGGANYIYSNRAAHSAADFVEAIKNPGRGRGHVPPPIGGTQTNLEEVLDVLGGGRSKWHPKVVDAVRQVLIDGKDRDYVLKDSGVSARQFNGLMDYIKELMGLVYKTGAKDDRKPRLERVRGILVSKVLGRELIRRDDDSGGWW